MEAMEGIVEGGQPAQPKPVTNAGRQYYFVSIKVDADTGMTSATERAPFVGLHIGLLLGKGAYGRVYKGYYHGKVVAVKVTPVCRLTHTHPVLLAHTVLHKQHPLGVYMSGTGYQGREMEAIYQHVQKCPLNVCVRHRRRSQMVQGTSGRLCASRSVTATRCGATSMGSRWKLI